MHLPLSLLVLSSGPAVVSNAFYIRSVPHTATASATARSAVIYGWDDDEESTTAGGDESTSSKSTLYATTSETSSYQTFASSFDEAAVCSPDGVAFAEQLTQDPERKGSLAKLAFAFCPPDQALNNLEEIDRVHVICVRESHIELEAILCEDLGCVSLNIPIQFPKACPAWSEGCALRNIDSLESESHTTIATLQNTSPQERLLASMDADDWTPLNTKVDFPSWWVPPDVDPTLVGECEAIQRLLNDDEFAASIVSVAEDGLQQATHNPHLDVNVIKAKVVAVGPAGLCLRVAVMEQTHQPPLRAEDLQFVDVVYPFGGEDHAKDSASLRAAVLGAVAAAEEKRPSHVYE